MRPYTAERGAEGHTLFVMVSGSLGGQGVLMHAQRG
jgi:hypothetical protein